MSASGAAPRLTLWRKEGSARALGVLKDEYTHTNDIPVALVGVKLGTESTDLPRRLGGSTRSQHGGETSEGGRLLPDLSEDLGASDILETRVKGKDSVSSSSAGVNYALGDAKKAQGERVSA